ncbi:GNAT family N-acetyltransferase [Paenibacillus nanensis]|uniref:GNAT family N-acetyltransferase n=1 Tax=Paenibacillus nanensis TaxID=393251 RepID=A0A3A1V1M6_9BACL|nr:GNAT family N-acetyltransferase [Paenibacillus nanensis]RIX53696.1 GNAT family N-acetyltransferase [Paenibacillus nanensis]
MITYSEEMSQKAADVADVFKRSGIKRPYEDLDRIQKMIDNADILITAWEDGRMVGVARAITDFSYCCYLSDLAIDRDYQKHGIGSEMVKKLQSIIGDECSLVLLSAPSAMQYYPRIGFEKADHAFFMKRKK